MRPSPATGESKLSCGRSKTSVPAERALLPGAMFDVDDLAVLGVALKCNRLGESTFDAAWGRWRDRARRGLVRQLIAAVPTKSVEPWPRAGEIFDLLGRQRRPARRNTFCTLTK